MSTENIHQFKETTECILNSLLEEFPHYVAIEPEKFLDKDGLSHEEGIIDFYWSCFSWLWQEGYIATSDQEKIINKDHTSPTIEIRLTKKGLLTTAKIQGDLTGNYSVMSAE